MKKPDGFIGKEALLERKARGPLQRRLVSVLVQDPAPQLFHAEIVLRDGKPVGYVRAASYGHTLGGSVGLAFLEPKQTVDEAYLTSGTWEVDIAGTRYPVDRFQPAAVRPEGGADENVAERWPRRVAPRQPQRAKGGTLRPGGFPPGR